MKPYRYKSKIAILLMTFVIGYVAIAVRVFFLQVVQKDFYEDLARSQYQASLTIRPPRATIFDRNGFAVALNQDVPSTFLLPKKLKFSSGADSFLKQYYPKVYQSFVANRNKKFMWLDRKIDQDRLAMLNRALGDDVCMLYEQKRYYPLQAIAHVVGFTDIDNKGLGGIELQFSKQLQGREKKILIQRDARSRNFYFNKSVEQEGVAGEAVSLTIDSSLQVIAHQELKDVVQEFKARSGSVLIINPDSGEILTMTNFPSFDPNQPVASTDLELTKNGIVTECYEMGSVMKIFTALSALQEGVVSYDEVIDCGYRIVYVDGFRIENPTITLNRLLEEQKGKLPFNQVVRYSSNVGIAKVAKRLGDKLYDYLGRCGFGCKTGLSFPGERDGFINKPKNWSRSSVLVMAFGYEIMATLLQLGKAMSIIANGGYQVYPHLVAGAAAHDKEHERLFDREPIEQVQEILKMIGQRFKVPGYIVRGKTGTARCIENGVYSPKKHIYTFAGVVEKGNYRRVIVTFVQETKKSSWWASQVTGPLFEKVARKMVAYEQGKGIC